MTNLDSKSISMVRFPLIVGVVCIHARAVNLDLWGHIPKPFRWRAWLHFCTFIFDNFWILVFQGIAR